jgi:sterol desaturase/sphingolipid hydroxylase (fatty acid hydroxylase superfamily)
LLVELDMTNDLDSVPASGRLSLSPGRAVLAGSIVGVLGLSGYLVAGSPDGTIEAARGLWRSIPFPIRRMLWDGVIFLMSVNPFAHPWLYIALGLAFVLERWRPAIETQSHLSRGFLQDLFWHVFDGVFWAVALAMVAVAIQYGYENYLRFMTIHAFADLPPLARIVMALLVVDFSNWLRHYIKHKVWWLWVFHAVHHSQTELNFFSDARVHVGERLFNVMFVLLTMTMFGVEMPTQYYIALGLDYYRRIYHANIRLNLGPLKYILVTPQAHRIHHSIETRHFDYNFGANLIIWDRLFGTLWTNYDEYPATGIPDGRFPHEQRTTGLASFFTTWYRQNAYPFMAIYRRLKYGETGKESLDTSKVQGHPPAPQTAPAVPEGA